MIPEERQELIEELITTVVKIVEAAVDGVNGRIQRLEDRVETDEQHMGLLTAAYGEFVVIIEALVARVGSGSPEELEAFKKDAAAGKKQLLDLLRQHLPEQNRAGFQPFDPDSS